MKSTGKQHLDGAIDSQSLNMESREKVKVHEDLLEAIRRGDEAAFSRYYLTFADPLISFLTRLTGDQEEAREIAQDVFMFLWMNREKIEPEKTLDKYIYGAAKNMAFNAMRKQRTHDKYSTETLHAPSGLGDSAEEALIGEEARIMLEKALDEMAPQRRKVFEMSRYEGKSYEEIAKELNISANTVHRHLTLALKELREALIAVAILFLFSH